MPRLVAVEADARTPAAVPMLSEVGVEGLLANLAEVSLVAIEDRGLSEDPAFQACCSPTCAEVGDEASEHLKEIQDTRLGTGVRMGPQARTTLAQPDLNALCRPSGP
jgi:hypothetical protein